jgi:hypothetical protein
VEEVLGENQLSASSAQARVGAEESGLSGLSGLTGRGGVSRLSGRSGSGLTGGTAFTAFLCPGVVGLFVE